MADSTRAMRRSIFERELLPRWRTRLLTEITPDDLRAHCGAIVERGAPATAIHAALTAVQIAEELLRRDAFCHDARAA
jgi:hypothetical protein